ncbi:PEP-CTERM sorting domain-containing protein [Aquisphaera insulae]|uniref:PEP-CTERM sorting domain-containing protein n=1 Tax=Aquisphaera insulae TaxID=2712864 RepID=UPI0013EB8226|nr:PEP-CTERM sorting domain-containing protein [Aquisphaera insulae]
MRKLIFATAIAALFSSGGRADAGPLDVTGLLSWTPNGANFDYSITLTNLATSTDSIETFWYAWVPGEDFLVTSPLSFTAPAGWTSTITHFPNVATNGYAIQFKTSTDALDPGHSLVFGFTSPDTPSMVTGLSTFFDHPPVGTSFVYSGQPFQGDALQFVVQAVPEPTSLALGLIAAPALAGLAIRRRRCRRAG